MDLERLAEIESLVAERVAVETELAGMQATNSVRFANGEAPAYYEESFIHLTAQLVQISTSLLKLSR